MDAMYLLYVVALIFWLSCGGVAWWLFVRYFEKKLHLLSFLLYLPLCLTLGSIVTIIYTVVFLLKATKAFVFIDWEQQK